MAVSIGLGFTAIPRRYVAAHRPGEALFGTSELSTAISISAGWLINAVVAEWVIRCPATRRCTAGRDQ